MLDLPSAVHTVRRLVGRSRGLHGLRRAGSQAAHRVAESLRAASTDRLTPEERAALDRIEALRARMERSATAVTRIDYGAGHPDAQRDEARMLAGVEVTDRLADIARIASKPAFWCRFLFRLIRTMRPVSCIEMGTALGISAAYQATALALNGAGRLTTLEGASALADIARSNLQALGLETVEVMVGRFQDTFPVTLAACRPVDYVFVDGHHDHKATLAYFEQMLPHLSPRALLVFDDIAWSDGMRAAWRDIQHDSRVAMAVDLGPVGLCLMEEAAGAPKHFTVPLG